MENLIMNKYLVKLTVVSACVISLLTGIPGSSHGQHIYGSKMSLSGLDYQNASQKQLKEEINKNPANTQARIRLIMSLFRGHQWVTARQHYDIAMNQIALKGYDKKPGEEFKQILGVNKNDLMTLENRFRLVGEQKLKIVEDKIAKGEKYDYSRVHEIFILYPQAVETRRDLFTNLLNHLENKAEMAVLSGQTKTDLFKWNHDVMLQLIQLYYVNGQYRRAAEICMRAMDYARNQEEEMYILSIFDRCSNATLITP